MPQSHKGSILVTGATGGIGGEVTRLLQESTVQFRVMCRQEEQRQGFEERGIQASLGDFGHPDSLRNAMSDVETLFLLTPGTPQQAAAGRNAVLAAMRSGVQRIVHLSTQDAALNSKIPWAAAPAVTDELVRHSGLQWTLLKPSAFMQNFFTLAPALARGILPQTSGSGVLGWIDANDIAAVAARVLTSAGHDGQEYILTGPEALSASDIARQLSGELSHRVRYLHLPGPAYRTLLRLTGVDAWAADGLMHQFVDVVRHGHDNARVMTDWVQRITGQPATSFTDFVRRHRTELGG